MAHSIVAFLISLAVGYWLLTLAEKQGGHTKTLGRVFAWIIIVGSLLGPVCIAAAAICRHCHGGRDGYSDRCSWNQGGWQGHGMDGACMTNGQCPMDGKGTMMKGQTAPEDMGKMDKKKGTTDDDKDDSK
jgi:hypothetical protein